MADSSETLDLEGSLRPGLDILANEIVIALKKRSRFPQNPEIYASGLVVGQPGVSLLDFELARNERLHAELGRYTYATQEAYSRLGEVTLIIKRPPPQAPTRNYAAGKAIAIKGFYTDWVRECCAPGSDSNTCGETVTADVGALLNLAERIMMGKAVAEAKYQKEGAAFRAVVDDPEAIVARLRNVAREAKVLEIARELAEHYFFDPVQAERFFAWMIRTTIAVEVDYIQKRVREDALGTPIS
jgi:chorismate mutase